MKKNTKKIALMLLVAFVAVGSYFVSGTYAKYTSSIEGTGEATVAKWAWKFGTNTIIDSSTAAENGFTIDLFDNVLDSNGTSAETDVHQTNSKVDRIAPGMTGEFEIALQNMSEVNATYEIQLVETQSNNGGTRIPIEYCSADDCTVAANWKTTITDANVSQTDITMGGTATKTIKWRWTYTTGSAGDTTDTNLGFLANDTEDKPTVSVTATVIVTQKD